MKDNMDRKQIKDPTEKLWEKIKFKILKFTLKTVSETKLRKVMNNMKKKKSGGWFLKLF